MQAFQQSKRTLGTPKATKARKTATKAVRKISTETGKKEEKDFFGAECLPRTRESLLKNEYKYIIGIDEAGRGPLAGPVVAAAAIVPTDIPGVIDSKKITREVDREKLYDDIVTSLGVRYAIAIVDASRIDEINILQATMQAMKMAAAAIIMKDPENRVEVACISVQGCYVVCGTNGTNPQDDQELHDRGSALAYALIDGNRVPKDMPLACESIIGGDSKEYAIAAASILAKVTRDRLMIGYDRLYPEYNFIQHKGYPTQAHRDAVRTHGASPIHRRTFAPLKTMNFDTNGKVIE